MAEVLKHKMWLKQVLKGFAERIPETEWQKYAERAYSEMPGWLQKKIDSCENLTEAYLLGKFFAALLFGGDDECS